MIDALYAREERRLRDALDQLPDDDVAAGFTALAEWADKTLGDPAWTRLEIEVAASSAHDEEQRAATAARYARMRASAAEFAQERFGDVAAARSRTFSPSRSSGSGSASAYSARPSRQSRGRCGATRCGRCSASACSSGSPWCSTAPGRTLATPATDH